MGEKCLYKPIIYIGMPRSGTTIIFEAFAALEELGWFSNYSARFPLYPSVNLLSRLFDNSLIFLRGNKIQGRGKGVGNRFLPKPAEAYSAWESACCCDFRRSYLLRKKATDEESERAKSLIGATLHYQNKKRFTAKLTGPPRIEYLASILSDAYFIHVIRDGRAVVHSLLNVGFWNDKGGLNAPYWYGGLTDTDIEQWEASARSPAVLAAVQWRRVIQTAREERQCLGEEQYREIRYEDFVANPNRVLEEICEWVELSPSKRMGQYAASLTLENRNYKWRAMAAQDKAAIREGVGPFLEDLGYE